MIRTNRFGELIRAGGTAAALNAFQHGGDLFRRTADGKLCDTLGVALAAVVDPAEGDDAVLNLQINGGGAGSDALIIEHNNLL